MLLKNNTTLEAHDYQVEAIHNFKELADLAQGFCASVKMILLGK